MLLVQVERDVEAVAQLGEVLQRAAQEGNVAADGAAARQAGDGLGDHGLEDGRGDVLGAGALVEQRLHVGLGKDAAAAGDGIDGGGVGRASSFRPPASVCSSAAIWSMNAPVPPAQVPFMRCSMPLSK